MQSWATRWRHTAGLEYRTHLLPAVLRPRVAAWRTHLVTTPSQRTGRSLNDSSIARKLSALAKFYCYAIDLQVLDTSSVGHVKRPKV